MAERHDMPYIVCGDDNEGGLMFWVVCSVILWAILLLAAYGAYQLVAG